MRIFNQLLEPFRQEMRNGFRDVHADIREVRTDITRLLDVTNPQGQGSITDDSEPRREVENAAARRQSSRLKRTVEAAPSDASENVNSQKRPADGAPSTTSEKKKRKTAATTLLKRERCVSWSRIISCIKQP